MTARTEQKLVQVGNARAVVIPKAWREQHPTCRTVHLLYDDIILIFPEDQAARVDRFCEQLIAHVAQESFALNKESPPHDTAAVRSEPSS